MENRRNQIVVNSDYQYREAKLAVSITVLAMNLLLIAGVLAPQLAKFQLVITQQGAFVIAGVRLLLFSGVWYSATRLSHRVAGPVYAFTIAMEKVGQGDLTAHLALREKDQFKEFADTFNKAISATNDKLEWVQAKLEEAWACSDAEKRQHLIKELREKSGEFTLAKRGENETE